MTPNRVTRNPDWAAARIRFACIGVLAIALAAVSASAFNTGAGQQGPPPPATTRPAPPSQAATRPAPPLDADAKTIEAFMERVKQYVALHQKLENTLPKLPKDATPQQLDKNQRALLELIARARRGAVRGALFTPDMEKYVLNMLKKVFSAPDGPALRASVMDENPMGVQFGVNYRYPDQVPLTTMPPEVLGALPKLPEELEYRFVSDRLILLDPHAHLVADYIDHAMPPAGPSRGRR